LQGKRVLPDRARFDRSLRGSHRCATGATDPHRFSAEPRFARATIIAASKSGLKIAVAFDPRICEKARHLSR
jgi:hypothetical protein